MGYILTRARLGLARVYHQLAQAQEASAQFDAATALFRQKQGYNFNMTWEGNDAHAYYDFASYHALVNQPEEALQCLQKAVQCDWADLPTMDAEGSFGLVRDKEEFQKIVQGLKNRKPL